MIQIKNVSKRFGQHEVISDLSFDVKEGEVFAFLGANGSGKTTTIRALLGIYQPTSGELLIKNKPFTHEMSAFIGYLPEERGLYLTAKALETLIYFGTLKGMSEHEAKTWALAYLDKVGLADKANAEIKRLSSGQQQKIQLGITMINTPELLILDEPTKGLDPLNRALLMDMLLELNKNGSTIIFVTHQMDEVEKIADRLVMIKDGTRVLYGDVDEVKSQFGSNTIHMRYDGVIPDDTSRYTFRAENKFAEITPQQDIHPNEVLRYLLDNGVTVQTFEVSSPSLNDIFIKISQEAYE